MSTVRWRVAVALLLTLFAATYRLVIFEGFRNDNFLHLARAQQMLLGELPVRDFPEVGMPLTEAISAAGQWVLGRTLWSEFLVSTTLLAASAGLLFLLAAWASGSTAVAVAVTFLHLTLEPRHYNYPKLLSYAAAIPLLWAYLDRPTRVRACAVGGAVAVAFLLRHDHGAYLAVAAAGAVALTRGRDVRPAVRDAGTMAAAALLVVTPFLVFVQMHGGLADYARTFAAFSAYETSRTLPRAPQRVQIDWSVPVLRVRPPSPPAISVRWADGVTLEERAARERAHGLTPMEGLSPGVSKYLMADWSQAKLEALVRDPAIDDTHGIDRQRLVIDDPAFDPHAEEWLGTLKRTEVLAGVLRAENAGPFLYYMFVLLPLISLVVLLGWAGGEASTPWPNTQRKMLVVILLALLINAGFLRGAVTDRLADVTVPVGVLGAWVMGVMLRVRSPRIRIVMRVGVALLFVLVGTSASAIERVPQRIWSSAMSSPLELGSRLERTRARLLGAPPAHAWDIDDPNPPPRLARYLHECTAPADRIFVFGYLPELFVLSGRGFAGGQPGLLSGFWQTLPAQRAMIDRLDSVPVPVVVVAVTDAVYEREYAGIYAFVEDYIRRHYGPLDPAGLPYRVLVRRDLQATRTYEILNWPCYHGEDGVRAGR